jgi:ribosomal protein S18 acetylase RimI-like enzyme
MGPTGGGTRRTTCGGPAAPTSSRSPTSTDESAASRAVDLPEGPQGEIFMLAVDPDLHGRGVGSALTDHAVEQIRAAGKRLAVVGTGGDPGHAAARATYERTGFRGQRSVTYYRLL